METLAVVCDDNIECHEDRDERLCATGADKYNPLVYAMTVGTCMIYMALKIVWFFYQRHLPLRQFTGSFLKDQIQICYIKDYF